MTHLHVLLISVPLLVPSLIAQKVKVGYDTSVDFSKYKSYTLQPPATPSNRPLLYASVAGTIQNQLESKGLMRRDSEGDLIVIAVGDLGYGLSPMPGLLSDSCRNCEAPMLDPRPWAGAPPPVSGTSGKPAPRGTLQLSFIERQTNKIVWSGSVVQKFDEEKKQQALQKIAAAIEKLLSDFPPSRAR